MRNVEVTQSTTASVQQPKSFVKMMLLLTAILTMLMTSDSCDNPSRSDVTRKNDVIMVTVAMTNTIALVLKVS